MKTRIAALLLGFVTAVPSAMAQQEETTEPPQSREESAQPAAQTPPPDDRARSRLEALDTRAAPYPTPARVPAQAGADWPWWGGGANATRYSPLDAIDRTNVGDLTRVFTYRTGDMPEGTAKGKYSPETTPLKIAETG